MGAAILETLGGQDGCIDIVEAFYRRVEGEPRLRALYSKRLRCAIHGLEAFLIILLGGETTWPIRRVTPFHRHIAIDREAADIWIRCMTAALEETVEDRQTRDALTRFFREAAKQLVNKSLHDDSTYGKGNPDEFADPLERAWARIRKSEELLRRIEDGDVPEDLDCDLAAEELLRHAASCGNDSAMESLRDRVTDMSKIKVDGKLMAERPRHAEQLLQWGASIPEGALIMAARGDKGEHPERIRQLLRYGSQLQERGRDGMSPLHYAVRAGHLQSAEVLIAAGADLQARDDRGKTPLDHARELGKVQVAQWLRAHGAAE